MWLPVGLTFLLAGLEDDPVVEKTRLAIKASIDKKHGMIASIAGDFDLEVRRTSQRKWQSCYSIGNKWTKRQRSRATPKVFKTIRGLIENQPLSR